VDILDHRALNRATLARQLLLERADISAFEALERLFGMQSQIPADPYTGLWSRLRAFDPIELSGLIAERKAVRTHLMRWTIHLVTAPDFALLRPLIQPVLDQRFLNGSPFGRLLKETGLDLRRLTEAGLELVDERPRTFPELRAALADRWPDHDAESMARGVVTFVPVVQVPPRGLWGATSRPTWASAAAWLDRPLDPTASLDQLVLRYVAALGPATVMDAQAWSGLTRLREVFDRRRPDLLIFRDERGRELFDLPEAPRPDPDTPAPVRFLPVFDNVLLGHADRARIMDDVAKRRLFGAGTIGNIGSVLVDGAVRALWRLMPGSGGRGGAIEIEPLGRLTREHRSEVGAEAGRLLELLSPGATMVRILRTGADLGRRR
jgi:hypothetical protein